MGGASEIMVLERKSDVLGGRYCCIGTGAPLFGIPISISGEVITGGTG